MILCTWIWSWMACWPFAYSTEWNFSFFCFYATIDTVFNSTRSFIVFYLIIIQRAHTDWLAPVEALVQFDWIRCATVNFFCPTRVFHAPKISQHKIIVFFFRFSFRFGSVVIRTHDYVRVNEISDDKNVLSFPRIVHLKLFSFFLFSFVESCFRFMFETFECVCTYLVLHPYMVRLSIVWMMMMLFARQHLMSAMAFFPSLLRLLRLRLLCVVVVVMRLLSRVYFENCTERPSDGERERKNKTKRKNVYLLLMPSLLLLLLLILFCICLCYQNSEFCETLALRFFFFFLRIRNHKSVIILHVPVSLLWSDSQFDYSIHRRYNSYYDNDCARVYWSRGTYTRYVTHNLLRSVTTSNYSVVKPLGSIGRHSMTENIFFQHFLVNSRDYVWLYRQSGVNEECGMQLHVPSLLAILMNVFVCVCVSLQFASATFTIEKFRSKMSNWIFVFMSGTNNTHTHTLARVFPSST